MKSKCPFFQVECLENRCTAYELRERRIEENDGLSIHIYPNQSYCNALNIYLPDVELLDE